MRSQWQNMWGLAPESQWDTLGGPRNNRGLNPKERSENLSYATGRLSTFIVGSFHLMRCPSYSLVGEAWGHAEGIRILLPRWQGQYEAQGKLLHRNATCNYKRSRSISKLLVPLLSQHEANSQEIRELRSQWQTEPLESPEWPHLKSSLGTWLKVLLLSKVLKLFPRSWLNLLQIVNSANLSLIPYLSS